MKRRADTRETVFEKDAQGRFRVFLFEGERIPEKDFMDQTLTPTRRKRLLKQFGTSPIGYTHQELEQFLDLLYGMFSFCYSLAELRQIRLSDPFDRSENPRQMAVIELAEWLEAVLT